MFRAVLAIALATALLAASTAAARPAAEPRKLDGTAVLSFKGVGAIKLKMGINEARKASHRTILGGKEVTKGCRVDTLLPRRFGLQMLRFDKKIRVIYVTRTAGPGTKKGVRVNDTLDRLRSKYGSKLLERGSDVSSEVRIFELHDGNREMHFKVGTADRITEISTGLRPEVDFDERCL
jgi:hypothetical protein